jgi:hypothetical protein
MSNMINKNNGKPHFVDLRDGGNMPKARIDWHGVALTAILLGSLSIWIGGIWAALRAWGLW